ncbi:MAG: nucleotidyltransferase family protein, partial [Ruminococcus sp.]|nr:nucleotidyltransferase family protein [Ruminococcus sp.]
MKVSGIICEYNPFHNGHLYHIEQTRKNGATHIVCVMSGNFVQRGDTAIMDKLERARLAVKCGADLVVELPVAFSLAPAESFATGAVWLLKSLGVVDELSFGSETGDVLALQKALSATEEASKYMVDEIVSIMDRGYTYPRALASVVDSIDENAGKILASPNNLLAVEYLKALKKFGSPMTPFTIKRSGADHDSPEASGGFMSASSVRERILEGKGGYGAYVPDVWAQ